MKIRLLAVFFVGIFALPTFAADVHITADFAASVDYPLVKTKFGVFNSGMVRPDRYARDIPLYGEVHPDSLRIDLGWGARWIGWKPEPISGTADNLHYDFREMDRIASLLHSQNVLAYWSYCYTPRPLQPRRSNYQGTPTDLKVWASILRTMAAHYRNFPGGDPVGYHEICNEPDNRDFFTGSRDDYLQMYRLGTAAVREGNPDAMVGGPALAFSNSWIDPFLDTVTGEKLPLDFYSFHYYPGCPYNPPDLHGVVRLMIDALDRRPQLRTTELHLNEFNSYRIDYPLGGTQDRAPIAAAFLHDVAYFLTQPAITRVYWAQFQDSGGGNFSGMIDMDGHRKALFNAYAAYARMPIDRKLLKIAGNVEGFASSDDYRSSVLLWNTSGKEQSIFLQMAHTRPADRVSVFRIDAKHASHGDGTTTETLDITEPPQSTHEWTGTLPKDGIVLIESNSNATTPITPPIAGKIIRELHDYPDRKSHSYADFDRNTWTARLGMGGETHGSPAVGVTAEGLPDHFSVEIEKDSQTTGTPCLRVDYQLKNIYAKSVIFRDSHADATEYAPPWGTQQPADSSVTTANPTHFVVDLKAQAPLGWTGRVQLTFMLQNAEPNTQIKMRLTR